VVSLWLILIELLFYHPFVVIVLFFLLFFLLAMGSGCFWIVNSRIGGILGVRWVQSMRERLIVLGVVHDKN